MGTNFLHGKKTYTTATLILVGAIYSGWIIFMPPYLDWLETTALHFHMISLPLQTV